MPDRELILPRAIARVAADGPDRPFLQEADGPSCTYGEAHELSLRWAAALRTLGIDAGETVACLLPPSLTSVVAWMGCAWAGLYEVPCNNEYQGPMLSYVIRNAGARVLIVDAQFVERVAAVAPDLGEVVAMVVTGELEREPTLPFALVRAGELLDAAEPVELPGPELWDIANVIYTSGTTGPSKGVLMPWGQMVAGCASRPVDEETDGCWYSPFPMFHLTGKVSVYRPALAGGRAVLRQRFSARQLWGDVARYGCQSMYMVGTVPSYLYHQPPRPDDAETPLRNVIMAPVLPEYREFERRFGVRITTVYNMSELSVPILADWGLPNHRTCGRLRDGYEVRIVDEHDMEVPAGEFGELIVRAVKPWTLNVGYLGMPEVTAQAWRNGWFHTGDGFVCDEHGNYYFVDRLKDTIRRRGENISSTEVEALVAAHPHVAANAVIGVPALHGEDEVKVVVVLRDGMTLEPEALLEFLDERLPRFMVPRYVEFVAELPLTPTNKVRKRELRAAALNPSTWDREAEGRHADA